MCRHGLTGGGEGVGRHRHTPNIVIIRISLSIHNIIIAIALLFVLFTLTTWGMNKISRNLSPILNWLHYGLTTICLVTIIALTNKLTSHPATHRDYNVLNQHEEYESSMAMNEWLALIFVIFILSQVLFLMNMIRAFIVKRKSL